MAVNTVRYPYTLLISDLIVIGPGEWNSHNPFDMQGGNLLFNDGHAKWKHFQNVTKLFTITGPPAVTFYY